ncbi:MAG: hypothetical protein J5819_06930 [Eubacterium sp.]|nr:hypothetical protein [Eubacterium sp.]
MSRKKKQEPEQEIDPEVKLEESRNTEERRMSGNGKSTPGYISRFRKNNIIWLIVWVALGVAIFVTGMLIWESRANILTVLAVLMVLPGAKRIVALVALGRKRSVSLERCHAVETAVEPYIYAGNLDLHEFDPEDELDTDPLEYDKSAAQNNPDDGLADENPDIDPSVEEEPIASDNTDDGSESISQQNERVIPWNVIFTDYIFTSSEKIMMLDFLVVTERKIIILLASANQDENYVKKYLTAGIRKWTESMDIRFVGDDDELLRAISGQHVSESGNQALLRERRETLAYLKSLAV